MLNVKVINQTDYANIFGIFDSEEKSRGGLVGTAELKLAGREAGKLFVMRISQNYTTVELRKAVKAFMDDEAKAIIDEYLEKARAK